MSMKDAEAFRDQVLADRKLQEEILNDLSSPEGVMLSRIGSRLGYEFTQEERMAAVNAVKSGEEDELTDFELELVQAASGSVDSCVEPNCNPNPGKTRYS